MSKNKDSRSFSDYFYYLLDLSASIIAITLALMTQEDNYALKATHLASAILFRYIYLAYYLFSMLNTNRYIFTKIYTL
jgi:hypothetical protein